MAHNDLGDFYRNRGDFTTAHKCYVRTRDYCSTSKHTISMCLNVIKSCIDMGNFLQVHNYVTKAESIPEVVDDPVITAQLRAASGLAHLDARKYKLAARKFSEITTQVDDVLGEMVSLQDVAIYGVLCALASFTRAELQEHVIQPPSFRAVLENCPKARELVLDFFSSKYASCLSHMEEMKPDLTLDIYLHTHIDELYKQIRSKALIQYSSPYHSIDMHRMASAFNTDISDLEEELATLIMQGAIEARIDSSSKILHARRVNDRHSTFEAALSLADSFRLNTKALMLRVHLSRNDLVLKGPGDRLGPIKSSRQERGGDLLRIEKCEEGKS